MLIFNTVSVARLELLKLCYHPGWRLMRLGYRTCFHMLYDEKKKIYIIKFISTNNKHFITYQSIYINVSHLLSISVCSILQIDNLYALMKVKKAKYLMLVNNSINKIILWRVCVFFFSVHFLLSDLFPVFSLWYIYTHNIYFESKTYKIKKQDKNSWLWDYSLHLK